MNNGNQSLILTQWPTNSLDLKDITAIFQSFALMDSNNIEENSCGVGEREGRIFSNLVKNRNFYLSHGIGRSGRIDDIQPKAIGSTIMSRLANKILLQVVESINDEMKSNCLVKEAFIIPLDVSMLCWFLIRVYLKSIAHESNKILIVSSDEIGSSPSVDDNYKRLSDLLNFSELTGSTTSANDSRLKKVCLDKLNDTVKENDLVIMCCSECCNLVNQKSDSKSIDTILANLNSKCFIVFWDYKGRYLPSLRSDYLLIKCISTVFDTPDPNNGSFVIYSNQEQKPSLILDQLKCHYPGRASAHCHIDFLTNALSIGSAKYVRSIQKNNNKLKLLLNYFRTQECKLIKTAWLCEFCDGVHIHLNEICSLNDSDENLLKILFAADVDNFDISVIVEHDKFSINRKELIDKIQLKRTNQENVKTLRYLLNNSNYEFYE